MSWAQIRVMFAVDHPYNGTLGQQGKDADGLLSTHRVARDFIDTAPISTEDKSKLAHLNAERLLLARA